MNVLDDLIHQLFSEVLTSGKEHGGHIFEEQKFAEACGFYHSGKYILDGSIGLLGLRHPLMVKANLKAALSPFLYTKKDLVAELYDDIQNFLSRFLGEVFITSSNINNQICFAPGRFTNILSEDDRVKLEGSDLNLNSFFTFDFSISKKNQEKDFNLVMSQCDYIYNKSVLTLLEHGQFFDKSHIISQREKYINEQISDLSSVSCKGLTINVGNLKLSEKISLSENTLILPIYFRESDLENLITIIKDSSCSL